MHPCILGSHHKTYMGTYDISHRPHPDPSFYFLLSTSRPLVSRVFALVVLRFTRTRGAGLMLHRTGSAPHEFRRCVVAVVEAAMSHSGPAISTLFDSYVQSAPGRCAIRTIRVWIENKKTEGRPNFRPVCLNANCSTSLIY